jgi:hypothetical protein
MADLAEATELVSVSWSTPTRLAGQAQAEEQLGDAPFRDGIAMLDGVAVPLGRGEDTFAMDKRGYAIEPRQRILYRCEWLDSFR